LFLYDVKCFDSDKHKHYVGASNELILENLRKLLRTGTPVWIRIPIIEGVNDTLEEMTKIKHFLATYGAPERTELLPYHKMGEGKYKALGMPATPFEAPDEQTMQSLKEVFEIK
jgi:pyruvate formate lyase activating enzyme